MLDKKALFVLILEASLKMQGFAPNEQEVDLMEKAFYGMFKTRGEGFLKNAKSWCGYVNRDGTIDEAKQLQCLQSAFTRLMFYHLGKDSAYLGTIINATQNLEWIAESYGICPHVIPDNLWKLGYDSAEYKSWQPKKDENKVILKKFSNHCDTFCQVFVFILKKGKTSSVAGDIWRKALGYDS